MKPNFALNFSDDGISLLHRTARGWLEVGSTALDAPDLGEALNYLRRSALGLAPHGVTSKLVIPNSQILYTEVDAPGPDDAHRLQQIRRALEGVTPYAVDDLAFDWSGDGPRVQVAVIARETLQEAEGFAAEYRFNPVSFVAIPDEGRFTGEPWFGPSSIAPEVLPQGESVERDAEPVLMISRETRAAEARHEATSPPEPIVSAAPEPAPVPKPEVEPVPEPAPVEPPAPVPAPVEEPAPAPEPEIPEPEPTPAEPEQPEPEAPQPDLPEPAPDLPPELPEPEPEPDLPPAEPELPEPAEPEIPLPEWEPEVELTAVQEVVAAAYEAAQHEAAPPPAEVAQQPELDFSPPPAAPAPPPQQVAAESVPEAPFISIDMEEAEELPARRRAVPPLARSPEVIPPVAPGKRSTGRRVADPGLPEEPPAFASRRAAGQEPPVSAEAPKLSVTNVTARRKAPAAPLSPPPLASTAAEARSYAPPAEDTATEDDVPPPLAPALQARLAAQRAAPVASRPTRTEAAKPAIARDAAAKAAKSLGGMVTAPGIPGLAAGRKAKPARQMSPQAAAETLVAPPPGAVGEPPFGIGRPARRGKPRFLGLILTAALLLLLGLIAAWSSFYLARGDDTAPAEVAGTDGTPTLAAPDSGADPAFAEAAPEDTPTTEDEAAADGVPLPEDEAAADGQALAPEAAPVTEPAPEAASGTGAAPVPLPGSQDEIILSTMDNPPEALDALALEAPQTTADAGPVAPAPPPPFGTQYEFGADGLIKPTAEGIVTPDGVRLVAGSPPRVPPTRPESIATQAAAAQAAAAPAAEATPAEPAPEAATATTAEPPPAADPALEGFRPKPRPEGLATAAPAQDDAALDIPADQRMTSRRPRERPASIAAQVEQRRLDEEARRVAEAASLSAAAAAEALAATATQTETPAVADRGPVSPLAVAISRRPAARPKDLSRAVEAAVAAAARPVKEAPAKEAEPEPKRVARSAIPGEDEEPDNVPAARAPKIPTKASVAKSATFVNAIDLRKTNLIGVYGTPAKRYALVRTGSGSYKKVRVGDRVDGGTVAAITDNELRYKKGSRMIALKMPKG